MGREDRRQERVGESVQDEHVGWRGRTWEGAVGLGWKLGCFISGFEKGLESGVGGQRGEGLEVGGVELER